MQNKRVNCPQLLLVGLMLLFAAAYFYQDPGWNGNARLDLTRAIVEHGSLPIDAYHAQPDWYTEDTGYYNGHYYPDKAPGSSLIAVPFYFLLVHIAAALHLELGSTLVKHVLTFLVVDVAFALGGIAMYRIAARLGASPRMALIATLATALGSMLWPYSAVFYGHVITGSLLLIAFDQLYAVRAGVSSRPALRYFAAGLAMGFAFIIEYPTALIILGLLVYAAFVATRGGMHMMIRRGLAAALGALFPVSPMVAYNIAAYGTPLAFGYAHEVNPSLAAGIASGVMGFRLPDMSVLYHITLDPRFGLLWLSPVLFLAPIGYFVGIRRRESRLESWLSLYAIGVMLLMNSAYYFWWGGSAFGPRLLIPALPFMIVPLALLPGAMEWPAAVLGAISAGQMMVPLMGIIQPALYFQPKVNEFIIDKLPFRGVSILYQYMIPLIFSRYQSGTSSWTLAAALHLPYGFSIPLLLVIEAALIVVYQRSTSLLNAKNEKANI